MDIAYIRKLAGQPPVEDDTNIMLDETTIIPENADIDMIISMLDAAKRGLGLANKLTNIEQRKRHVRAVFINLNKIRSALAQYINNVA